MAELAIVAVAPGVDAALIIEIGRVLLTAGDVNHAPAARSNKKHFGLHHLGGISTDAQLTVPIVTEGMDLAPLVEHHGVIAATRHAHHILEALHLAGSGLIGG